MDCPVCKNTKLLMSDRQGIEIDYCPNCRGVWLDRGELDKIIERSAGELSPAPSRQQTPPPPPSQSHSPQGYGYPQQGHYRKKRKGFLGELFDFD